MAQAEENGTPLPASLLVTFDSPMQGAVIDSYLLDWFEDKIDDFAQMNNDAAKQMLVYNPYNTSNVHNEFFDELDTIGNNGFPSGIPTIGIAFSRNTPNPGDGIDWFEIKKPLPNLTFKVEDDWALAGSLLPLAATNIDPRNIPWYVGGGILGGDVEFDRKRFDANPTFVPYKSALDIVDGKSKFCFPIETTISDPLSYHDEIPNSTVDAFIGIIRGLEFDEVQANETFNFTSKIGRFLVTDLDIKGTMFVNKNAFSGSSFAPEAPAPLPSFDLLTSSCYPITITVENNAELQIGDGSSFVGNTILNGSTMIVESGSTLNIRDGSTLVIGENSKLIINANSDINLSGFNSSIHIKNGGELVINGAFNFDGSGFFEFDEYNILTLNAPFELTGNGKTDRFIRLNNNATLDIAGGEIILQRGLVEYQREGKIEIGQNGKADIEHVTLEGGNVQNGSIGINVVDASEIKIFYTDVNNFETGINVYGMNLSTDEFKLTLVNFNDCAEGIVAELCKFLELVAVHFSPHDNTSLAMLLSNVETIDFGGSANGYDFSLGAINIYNDLTAINDNLDEMTHLKLDHTDLLNNKIGVYVSDDSRADIVVTNNSLIDGNDYGIKAGEANYPAYANVTVNRGATISNNQTGIFIAKGLTYSSTQGNKDYGVVEMTCAKLLDNTIGVDGEDLWLNIDACVNSGQTTASCDYTKTYPNHFKSTSIFNKLFRICYAVRTPIPIEATGNYWDLATNTTVPDYISIDDNIGAGCSGLAFDYSNAATAAPTKCEEISIQQLPNHIVLLDSLVTGGGSSITCLYSDGTSNNLKMNIQYINAYADYMEEDYTSSANLFLELANISDAAQDAYCTPCQHYINIARSRTFYTPNVPDAAFSAQIDNNINQNKTTFSKEDIDIPVLDVKIFPNPTYGELNIKTNSEQSIIRIIDLHGRVKVMLNDGLDYQINTQSWAAGIYIVEITDQITMEVVQRRIVVQP